MPKYADFENLRGSVTLLYLPTPLSRMWRISLVYAGYSPRAFADAANLATQFGWYAWRFVSDDDVTPGTLRVPTKWVTEYIVQGYYVPGFGWEDVDTHDNRRDARASLKVYNQEETRHPHRIIARRVPNPAYNVECCHAQTKQTVGVLCYTHTRCAICGAWLD